jgi:hypothetical protein
MPTKLSIHAVHQGGTHMIAGAGDIQVSMDYPWPPGVSQGLSPLMLLLASLAGCSGDTLFAIPVRCQKQPVRGLEVTDLSRTRRATRLVPLLVVLGALPLLPLFFSTPAPAAPDTRGWLGIYHEPISPLPAVETQAGGAAALRGATAGLLVTAVFLDSPADQGGLLRRDIIIAVHGVPFTCPPESLGATFLRWMTPLQAGEICPVLVLRDGVERTLRRDAQPATRGDEAAFWWKPGVLLDSLRSGETLEARAEKRQQVLELPVVLGLHPEACWAPGLTDSAIAPPGRFAEGDLAPLTRALVDAHGLRADTDDLFARLAKCQETADPQRLSCMTYVHRHPFRAEAVAREVSGFFLGERDPAPLLDYAGSLWIRGRETAGWAGMADHSDRTGVGSNGADRWGADHVADRPPRSETGVPEPAASESKGPDSAGRPPTPATSPAERNALIDPLVIEITTILAAATEHHRRAFAAFTGEERRFLETSRFDLSDAFAADIYLHLDEDRERFRRNHRLVELSERVDRAALLDAGRELSRLVDPVWAVSAGSIIRAAWADSLDREILVDRKTPYGRVLFGGTSRHWYRDLDAAFILDLDGDDFYTGNNGGSNAWVLPVAACADLGGNDAYESTLNSCQGAGVLGVGALLDCAGDDQYIGIQWCQGIGYFGVGWLRDLNGNDTYRGRSFCQGVGLFGIGLLIDEAGRDRYEGDVHVQGTGLPGGIGAVIDRAGDDEYYAKGLVPTNYGDAGIFDAWSQGCGMGFRTVASGGLGLLVDGSGADRMEAGNFSQGGGYYYGLGILRAAGRDGDRYLGSRYNQGFTAHQAVGVFLDDGGDDFYTTRQAVAQGLAWDECVTVFDDAQGNDTYQGGNGFSQGASAHNSVCLFRDRGGLDTYDYTPGQALAGGNDYHGGSSLSLFIDEGGADDLYDSAASRNGAFRLRPQHGFFLDLPGDCREAFRSGAWREMPRSE